MVALGIDFGTSTTVTATHRGGRTEVTRSAAGDDVIPSAIAFLPDGRVLIGKDARKRSLIDASNALHSVKRILGRRWESAEVRKFAADYPFELERGEDDLPLFVTRAGKLTAVDVTAKLLQSIREFPIFLQASVDAATVTVPASASEAQRKATVLATTEAGLPRVDVIEEPCAAALAYLHRNRREQTVIVYDLGGGTFDVAALRWTGSDFELLGVGGDSYLGGDDVDFSCANWAADCILAEHRWDVRTRAQSFQNLIWGCEQAKIAVSREAEAQVDLKPIDEVLAGRSVTFGRKQVEQLCTDLVRRSFILCDEVLSDARLTVSKVNAVVMAGGSTYMPIIRQTLEQYFGKAPTARIGLSPDKIVAVGAALHAESRRG